MLLLYDSHNTIDKSHLSAGKCFNSSFSTRPLLCSKNFALDNSYVPVSSTSDSSNIMTPMSYTRLPLQWCYSIRMEQADCSKGINYKTLVIEIYYFKHGHIHVLYVLVKLDRVWLLTTVQITSTIL